MCQSLSGAREALVSFATSFDPSRVTTHDAAALLADAAVIERTAAALTVQLSARAAQSGSWQVEGSPSAAHSLARQTGLSLAAAQQRLEVGRRLTEQPEIALAANAGRLSAVQLVAVSDAVASDPAAAARLVELAVRSGVGELHDECRRTKAAAAHDGESRRARIHAQRSLRQYTDAEGAGHLQLTENPETIAELLAAISPHRERLFQAARRAGRHERADALDADALTGFIREAAGQAGQQQAGQQKARPTAAKILVRVDLDTMLRGYPIAGEVCEIAGFGPIAVSAVTDMMSTGNAFLVALATRGQQVIGVAHLGRKPTAYQDSALQWSQPVCAAEGCNRARRLERDHQQPWAKTKITLLEWLDRLCEHHHEFKTHHGWALVNGSGKRPFVPPTDPRHPEHPDHPQNQDRSLNEPGNAISTVPRPRASEPPSARASEPPRPRSGEPPAPAPVTPQRPPPPNPG